jgi:hypothetical protein
VARHAEVFMRPIFFIALVCACSDPDPVARPDGGSRADGGGPELDGGRDAGEPSNDDAGTDGGTSGCVQASASDILFEFGDDVSIHYRAPLTPIVPDTGSRMEIFFERYVPGPDIGTFELGSGPDANYGTCHHCVVIPTLSADRVYFADRGTFELTADPYERRLRGSLANVRFIESMVNLETRASTPIEGGRCIEIADLQLDEAFPFEGWTCDLALFGDTEACNCECGSFDPDCTRFFCEPGDPECPAPLPLADCDEGDVCGGLLSGIGDGPIGFEPLPTRCFETCTWGETACESGACLFETGLHAAEVCGIGEDEVSAARVGEMCARRPFMRPCNVVGGFAQGYCDGESVCQPLCERDRDCTGGTTCQPLFGTLGYCAFPETPE